MSTVIERTPLESGRDAIRKHLWREAFDLLSEAESQEPLPVDDLVSLAEAAWWSGRLDDSIAARERAYALYLDQGQPRRAARLALALCWDYYSKRQESLAQGWYNRAERLLENEPESVEHGYLSMVQADAALSSQDHDAAIQLAKKTLDIGTRFGNRDLQGLGLLSEGVALVEKGDVKEGLQLLDEATVAAVSGELGPLASGIVYCHAITTTSKLADYARAGDWTDAAKRWCERQSITGFPGICRVHRAEIMRLRGLWNEAEQEARRAVSELSNFNLNVAGEAFYEIGEIRLRMGDLPAAEDAFRQAHELGREPQPGLALLRFSEGKVDAAAASLRRRLDDPSVDRLARARMLPLQVEIAVAAGDLDVARAGAAELEATAAVFDSPAMNACAHYAAGMVQLADGDADAAATSFRKGWRLWQDADLPHEAAHARMMLGLALREDGDEDGAMLELGASKATFERLGALLDLRRVMALLGHEVVDGVPVAPLPGTRVTKTFMFTDIVASTNLAEAMGDAVWESLLDWHDLTLRKLFQKHCGEEVKHIGDGFFVAFENSPDAVACAIEIQRRLSEHRKEHGFAPMVRIGLHCVEATRKGRDYGGKGVHEAARIGALAGGGEVLASRQVIEEAGPRVRASAWRSVQVKGVSEPLDLASIEI